MLADTMIEQIGSMESSRGLQEKEKLTSMPLVMYLQAVTERCRKNSERNREEESETRDW